MGNIEIQNFDIFHHCSIFYATKHGILWKTKKKKKKSACVREWESRSRGTLIREADTGEERPTDEVGEWKNRFWEDDDVSTFKGENVTNWAALCSGRPAGSLGVPCFVLGETLSKWSPAWQPIRLCLVLKVLKKDKEKKNLLFNCNIKNFKNQI